MNEKEVSHPQLISISEVRGRGRAGNSSEPCLFLPCPRQVPAETGQDTGVTVLVTDSPWSQEDPHAQFIDTSQSESYRPGKHEGFQHIRLLLILVSG